ncbi:hypothetical protein HYH03_017733 [Edaphochlamys debaryana]|uniref:FAD/NAD(P)-binding domain-containing protein n=1 Tax=Edaphochlamys debaryana TaxID=47281 RepID=A0A835XG06_9CHLO|nr:hypothetical protein HYH03_017733 [Edaphochlamys debaryana]|eukprot:KAG2483378.1 hypothetical protein HYH03_017733 [Edaphochlamys debaryana]
MSQSGKKVIVVGAGVHGISAAKTFKDFGYQVTVYERQSDLGGVWAPENHWPGMRTPPQLDVEYPVPAANVYAYLRAYAEEQGVAPLMKFQTDVVKAVPVYAKEAGGDAGPPTGWALHLRHQPSGREFTDACDVLIVAVGLYNKPNIPQYPGLDAFKAGGGQVLHTQQLWAALKKLPDCAAAGVGLGALVAGKRVVVVGNGKSGDDVTHLIADSGAAKSVTQICRSRTWVVPRFFPGGLHFKYPLCTRLGCALLKPLHPPVWPFSWLHSLLAWGNWRMVEAQIKMVQPLAQIKAVPRDAIERSIQGAVHIEPGSPGNTLFKMVADGRITQVDGEFGGFGAGVAQLASGATLEADLVILATGYDRSISFLPPEITGKILGPKGELDMYLKIYPQEVGGSSLFITGWDVGLYPPLEADLASRWAVEMVEGRIKVTPDQMRAYNKHLHDWADANFTPSTALDIKRGFAHSFSIDHMDDMLYSMGGNWRSLTWGEYLTLYTAPISAGLYGKAMAAIKTK